MIATVIALAAIQHTLRIEFVVGATHKYEQRLRYVSEDATEMLEFVTDLTYEVAEIDPTGMAKIRVGRLLTETIVDGESFPQKDPKAVNWTEERRSPRGDVYDRTLTGSDGLLRARIERLSDIQFDAESIEIGGTWTFEWPDDDPNGLPGAVWSYRLESVIEGVAEIFVGYSELGVLPPITARGLVKVDAETGWIISYELDAKHLIVPGDDERMPMILRMTLIRKDADSS
ncbi:MAG: hypothetical protein IH944_10405 [Armatimonadetes bacterium]|nr:hypothetical protein [Armatimonadota bacterium]